jgi:hypothetical protein
MKKLLLLLLLWSLPAAAQAPFQTSLGFCNLGSVASAVGITSTNCVFASFTGVIAGNQLTTSSVTGSVLPGQPIVGTGVPSGTYVLRTVSGGGANAAGVYLLSTTSTVSSESMTAAGIPPFAKYVLLCASTQNVNWRDDGVAPTASASGGQPIPASSTNGPNCIGYNATLQASTTLPGGSISNLQFIQQAATAALNASFYQ